MHHIRVCVCFYTVGNEKCLHTIHTHREFRFLFYLSLNIFIHRSVVCRRAWMRDEGLSDATTYKNKCLSLSYTNFLVGMFEQTQFYLNWASQANSRSSFTDEKDIIYNEFSVRHTRLWWVYDVYNIYISCSYSL